MSLSKIENKIELLENKLKEIDTTITDSIERNEYKIELQKQVKKLKRTKSNLEQLHQEQQELESLRYEVSIVYEKSENKQQISQQLPEKILEADKTEAKKIEARVIEQTQSDWDLPIIQSSDDWTNDYATLVPNSSAFSKNSTKLPKNKTNHLIFLSEKAILVSSIFAIFGFIFPYIYTRRWKPLCILITALVSTTIFISDESTLIAAPWISAIDNGIAISKSKNKVKHKLS
ncbi:MAG: hypothetical protein ACFCU7_13410 [Pleurocapsa sp.]